MKRVFALALLCALAGNVYAIVRRHDREDAQYLALGGKFEFVGRFGNAGCTLIAPRWAITAAHVIEDAPPFVEHEVTFAGRNYRVAKIIIHPLRKRGAVDSSADLALLALAEPVAGVAPVPLYSAGDEPDKIATIVGHGESGTGLTGPVIERGQRRGATNRIEGALENSLLTAFDAPPGGTDLEGTTGPGDSGSALLLPDGDGVALAGICSFSFARGAADGTQRFYGTISGFARVSTRRQWILDTMAKDPPSSMWEPLTRLHGDAWPQTPFGRAAAAFIDAFNSADLGNMAKFIENHSRPSKRTPAERAAPWAEIVAQYAPYQVHGFTTDGRGRWAMLVHSAKTKQWRGVMFEIQDNRVASMEMWDAAAPPADKPSDFSAVINDVAANIGSYFLFPEKRAALVAALREAEKKGRYRLTDASVLAGRITEDLFAASGDRHVSLTLDPAEYAALSSDDAQPASVEDYEETRARATNSGIAELRILPGNVRCARITSFIWSDAISGRAIEEAARFLRDGDSVIVDLRGNSGGYGTAVQQLISHFVPPGEELIRFYNAVTGVTRPSLSLGYLPGGRMIGKPLFVLIDGLTGSAAESFAYIVQQSKLGTLIGEKTAGAANNPAHFPIAPAFVLRLSIGRPIHPASGTNWEGSGVRPDVAAASSEAFDVAHGRALEQLATNADDAVKARVEWALTGVRARLQPVRLSADELARYEGRYDGGRSVQRDGEVLTYQRAGGAVVPLTPLLPDLFAFGASETTRIGFTREDGRIVALEVLSADRPPARAEKQPY
ncbi:MAG TPA: S41 family peptidase [Thermoanaerobaculia bacterium]|nr:S41 family peptidase [Thermoanaerobaculia bacterium]